MRGRTALITGVTGQDGAYLAEFLLGKGYQVHGIKRRSSSFNTGRVDHLYVDPHETGEDFHLHYGDVTDATNLIRLIQETEPDEIYNLAAQSHVQVSFETRSTRQMPTRWEHSAFWKRSVSWALLIAHGFIRLPRPSCSEMHRKHPRARRLPSGPAAPMRRPSSMPTGLR